MTSEQKLDESEFQCECIYCGKINLLEKQREVFFGLRDCLEANLREIKDLKEDREKLTKSVAKLNANVDTLQKANTNLVLEYEEKLCCEREKINELNGKLEKYADYDKLTETHNQLTIRFNNVSDKMESVIKQNTELTKQNRELASQVEDLKRELEKAKIESRSESPEVSVDSEAFRAKIKAELEKEQKENIEKIKSEFSQRFEEMRKSYSLKVQPLDKKKI